MLLLVLVSPGEALAAPLRSVPRFPIQLTAEVLGQALAFIEPRTLSPYPVRTLALWGLGGLSLLDPSLSTEVSRGKLSLSLPDRVLAIVPAPESADAAAWGRAIAIVASVAWRDSQEVRALGPDSVIQAFFDELFNHFDPYSRYVPPAQAGPERAARAGLSGTGITLAVWNRAVLVGRVISGSPAARAGVRAGQRLLAVDGAAVTGKALSALTAELAGPAGSSVALTLADPRGGVRRVALVRRPVPPETVFSTRDGDLLVLRISAFDAGTGPQLANEIVAGLSVANPPKGIVLDLRGNRGGLLDQAVHAANVLLARGMIASTAGRDPAAAHLWQAGGADLSSGLPIVVMVDGLTASAAEILSAALADNGRAVVLGSATLGKGLVQT
ncbi:MAG: S41 family peptidase, partial [Acetobacteraceae bacterium]